LVHFPFGLVVIATLSFVNKSNDEFRFPVFRNLTVTEIFLVFFHAITLHASCGTVYCNWSCLWVCGCVCLFVGLLPW